MRKSRFIDSGRMIFLFALIAFAFSVKAPYARAFPFIAKAGGDLPLLADAGDTAALGSRQPIILIHGWNSNADKWNNFAAFFKNSGLSKEYKLYRFSYDWERHIQENGNLLYSEIMRQHWDGRRIFIVAHSMGGLVARSAIESHPDLAKQLALLIMLGTPNHGTPMANLAWIQNYSSISSFGLDPVLKEATQNWNTKYRAPLNCPGGWDLGWDDYDDKMPTDVLNGTGNFSYLPGSLRIPIWVPFSAIPKSDDFTRKLNKHFTSSLAKTLAKKYIAIGSYRTKVPHIGYDYHLLGTIILARSFQDEYYNPIANYVANDYVVPLQSALFLKDELNDNNVLTTTLSGESVSLSKDDVSESKEKIDISGLNDVLRNAGLPIGDDSVLAYYNLNGNKSNASQAIIFKNIYHTDLPDNINVQNKIKELLLDNWSAPPKVRPPSPNYAYPPTLDQTNVAPILVIDHSGSIQSDGGVMSQVINQANQVVNAIVKVDGSAAVINFSGPGNSAMDADFTNNSRTLLQAISHPSINGGTDGSGIYDVIVTAVNEAIQHDKTARLILFTDGIDHGSRNSITEAANYCKKHDVSVVIVGFKGTEGRNDDALNAIVNGDNKNGFYVKSEDMNVENVLQREKAYYQDVVGAKPRGSAD